MGKGVNRNKTAIDKLLWYNLKPAFRLNKHQIQSNLSLK